MRAVYQTYFRINLFFKNTDILGILYHEFYLHSLLNKIYMLILTINSSIAPSNQAEFILTKVC